MTSAYLKWQLRKFSRRYGYDITYLNDLVDTDLAGSTKLAMASFFLNHRFGLPAVPYFAAKIVAVQTADCGSCLKLAIRMTEEGGIAHRDIVALVAGPFEQVPEDMALAARYAMAVLDNAPELVEIITECEARWGERGVAGLAAAVVSGAFYPTLKRGLGHGNSCEPVIAWLRSRGKSKIAIPKEKITV